MILMVTYLRLKLGNPGDCVEHSMKSTGSVSNEKKSSIYILGGVGAAKIERTYTTIVEGVYNNNDWTYGTLFGFGSEHLVSDNISLKIEHIISNYGEEKINTNASWANTKQYMDLNDSTTHVGLQYRF